MTELHIYRFKLFTIQDMAKTLGTNRTYLNAYIKDKYHATFCEWITGLRLEYAKTMLKEHPEMSIQKIAESSGFCPAVILSSRSLKRKDAHPPNGENHSQIHGLRTCAQSTKSAQSTKISAHITICKVLIQQIL